MSEFTTCALFLSESIGNYTHRILFISTFHNGYSVYADGKIEQWLFDGNVTTVSSQGDFYLPIYFSNTKYAVIGKGMRGGSSNSDFNLVVKGNNWFQLAATVYAWNFLCIGY